MLFRSVILAHELSRIGAGELGVVHLECDVRVEGGKAVARGVASDPPPFQDERSQHKNRARAMSLLQAKLLSAEQESQRASQASERRSLVGSGDRSERIRTYKFPQGRITDHRINLTLYKLDEVVSGDLDGVTG